MLLALPSLGSGLFVDDYLLRATISGAPAALSCRYLERPFLRLKGRFTFVPSSPMSASAAVAP